MANKIGSLNIELSANTAAFGEAMTKATYTAQQSAKNISKAFEGIAGKLSEALSGIGGPLGSILSGLTSQIGAISDAFEKMKGSGAIAGGAILGVGGAAIAAVAGMVELTKSGMEVREQFELLSQKTGISVVNLQTLAAAGASVGLSTEEVGQAFKKFSQGISGVGKNAGLTQAVLRSYGITTKDMNEALLEVADTFQKMPDGPLKSADAVALFGKAGTAMIPFLDKGRDGIKEWDAIVKQFAPDLSNGTDKLNEWKKSTIEVGLAWDKLSVTLGNFSSGPAKGLAQWLSNISDQTKASGVLGTLGGLMGAGLWGGNAATKQNADSFDAAKAESDQKQKQLDIQTAINKSFKDSYDLQVAGSQAVLNLTNLQQEISDAVSQDNFKQANALEAQLPALQAIVDRMKEEEKIWQRINRLIGAGEASGHGKKPAFTPPTDMTAPEVGAVSQSTLDAFAKAAKLNDDFMDGLHQGQKALADFWQSYGAGAKQTVAQVEQYYAEEASRWEDMLKQKMISQKDFDTVMAQLQKNQAQAVQGAGAANGNIGAQFSTVFNQWSMKVSDATEAFFKSFLDGIDDLNKGLAEFLVTGKHMDLKKSMQKMGEGMINTGLKTGESKLGGMLGLSGFGKPDGSAANPLHVIDASLGASSLPGSSSPNPFSFLSGLGIPGLATGGPVEAGHAYMVGERAPEFFVPRTPGSIVKSLPTGGSAPVIVTNHFHGVRDHDSFKANENQIMNKMANAVGRATGRR